MTNSKPGSDGDHSRRIDAFDLIAELRSKRQPFAVATVIETDGSVSAKTASKAVIDVEGNMLGGWVGGGCAEGAVRKAALDCLATGRTAVLDLDLDDEVLGTGMPCGGTMRVYVEPVLPQPSLWILGHGRIAECLCLMGSELGFHVVVDDPDADREHYPAAAQLIADDLDYSQLTPGAADFVVIATQHKGDHESLQAVLRRHLPYIGLVASRKRSRLVLEYLRKEGFGDAELARVHAPAGLDLGARSPEEIALSVMSEIVLLRRGGSGATMRREAGQQGQPLESTLA
ncbi:MAG: XdhC family protein [Proteobacteria bacterium]|nr:XdhC family protein [Pseudomonadota bacterium]